MEVKDILQLIKDETFVCSVCGETIFPKITDLDVEKGELSLEKSTNCTRGGFANGIVQDNICDECVKKAHFFAINNERKLKSELDEFLNRGGAKW